MCAARCKCCGCNTSAVGPQATHSRASNKVCGKNARTCARSCNTATTVRIRDGKRLVQDGPFADTKEQLGGYFVIEVPDLDAALEWAARAPSAACASVEVRPVLPPMAPPGA